MSVPFVDHAFTQIQRNKIVVSILGSDAASVGDRCVTFQGHIHLTTWYHIPEDLNFQKLNSENLCFFRFDSGALLLYLTFCFIPYYIHNSHLLHFHIFIVYLMVLSVPPQIMLY
jgi:hypothetical protein